MKNQRLLLIALILLMLSSLHAADWTFMVYIAGDNNLEGAGVTDVNEMETVGSSENVNIVVQFDRISGYDATNGDWTDTRRGLITKDDNTEMINSTLTSIGEKNMADPATLTEFINWGITNYPADHYAVILWNHGGGWRSYDEYMEKQLAQLKQEAVKAKTPTDRKGAISRYLEKKEDYKKPLLLKDVCYDDTSGGDALYTKEVRQALENVGQNIDILGFDACLMAMIEVAYEIRNEASIMVSSQNTEPSDGWPYDLIMSDLVGAPSMSPAELGTSIVTNYSLSYGGAETQSAIDLSNMDSFTTALDAFAGAMISADSEWNSLFQARSQAGYFYDADFRDLFSMLESMTNMASDSNVVSNADQAATLLKSMVIANESSPSYGGTGLSVYINNIETEINNQYNAQNILFAADTRWDEMLKAFSGQTIPDDEYEENDIGEHAATLDFGIHKALCCKDEDWYRFYVPENGRPTIAAIHDYDSGDLDIEVYNGSGVLMASGASTSDHEAVTFKAPAAAYYAVRVFGYAGDMNYYYDLSILDAESEAGYSLSEVSYYYHAPVDSATRLEMGDDDFTAVSLGFPFTFYGRSYSSIKISANGYLTFSYVGGEYYNLPLPIPGEPNSIIAPFWDDLVPPDSNGGVYYEIDKTPGDEKFIVSWVNCGQWTFSGPTPGVTFQAILYRNGRIRFSYKDVKFSDGNYDNTQYDNGQEATAGCENENGIKAKLISYNSASLTSGKSLMLTPDRKHDVPGILWAIY